MLGRYDRQLEAKQAADYFEALSAPAKRLVWFEESAHNISFEEPERFVEALKAILVERAGLTDLHSGISGVSA
jgi:proline iminopeptidase